MGEDKVALQLFQLVGRDDFLSEPTKACIDTIYRPAFLQDCLHDLGAVVHHVTAGRIELNFNPALEYCPQVIEGHMSRREG